jgi:hypothetical protein
MPKPTNHYGRVYLSHAGGMTHVARIWSPAGKDIWHQAADSWDQGFDAMKQAAKSMSSVVGPIDLYQGAEIVETVSVDLPF